MISYNRNYESKIEWRNSPNQSSPINADNLGRGDYSLNYMDYYLSQIAGEFNQLGDEFTIFKDSYEITRDMVHDHERRITDNTNRSITNAENILKSLKSLTYNTTTGVFVFTWHNGLTKTIDLNIEKIPVSFTLSPSGILTMTNTDGTKYTCDISSIIKNYNFIESSTIQPVLISGDDLNRTVKFEILDGSIDERHLRPRYLEEITEQADRAEAAVFGTILADFKINEDGDLIYTKYKNSDIILKDVNFAIIDNDYLEVIING